MTLLNGQLYTKYVYFSISSLFFKYILTFLFTKQPDWLSYTLSSVQNPLFYLNCFGRGCVSCILQIILIFWLLLLEFRSNFSPKIESTSGFHYCICCSYRPQMHYLKQWTENIIFFLSKFRSTFHIARHFVKVWQPRNISYCICNFI